MLPDQRGTRPGYGEGLHLVVTMIASTNASGNARFSCVRSLPVVGQLPGQTVSATATNIVVSGESSEFSKNKAITAVAREEMGL